MKQPGRVSADAASVVVPPEATLPRPTPPAHLRAPEAAEWCAIIERMGPDWLPRETHGLLETFVAVKCQLETVNKALAAFEPIPEDQPRWQRYRELTRLRGQLAAQLASLATKLRLTPQSRVHRYTAATQARRRASRPPPWALGDEGDPPVG